MAFSFQTFSEITPAGQVMINDAYFALHPHPHPRSVSWTSFSWKGDLPFLFKPVLEDDLVNDLAAKNATPSGELLTDSVKLLKYHHAATSMTSHNSLQNSNCVNLKANFVPKRKVFEMINNFGGLQFICWIYSGCIKNQKCTNFDIIFLFYHPSEDNL